ncbi:MAG: aldo/keto reductase [Tannerellaceae bacterium]|jgi:aryl-alcohol dehydrogenase-like predicted oxidoreductase|nr:aldo/keto reductase [Tannerellaceae bacterium]
MMKQQSAVANHMNRRRFIRTSISGVAGLSLAGQGMAGITSILLKEVVVDRVKLGDSGLVVSRIAMGTGTVGGGKASNQTRLGTDAFVKMAHHAYERGLRFFDMADSYGSQPFVGAALKGLPREQVTLLTKLWTYPDGSDKVEPVKENIDRIRREIGTDYIDILLMHCMMEGDWTKNRTHYMDGFSKAKQDGIVKAVGVSCHSLDALANAAEFPWVDVILARINPFGTNMDADPDTVKAILAKAKQNGKGVIGMKIFGEGKHVTDEERERSIRFAVTEGNIHCMTLGLESIAQMDDAIERVMKIH